jgi:hypothetical protein
MQTRPSDNSLGWNVAMSDGSQRVSIPVCLNAVFLENAVAAEFFLGEATDDFCDLAP